MRAQFQSSQIHSLTVRLQNIPAVCRQLWRRLYPIPKSKLYPTFQRNESQRARNLVPLPHAALLIYLQENQAQ